MRSGEVSQADALPSCSGLLEPGRLQLETLLSGVVSVARAVTSDEALAPATWSPVSYREDDEDCEVHDVHELIDVTRVELGIPESPRGVDRVMSTLIARVARSGVNTRSPAYLGYLPSGGLVTAAVGDFLASLCNPYSALESMSPGAVAIERAVVDWLASVVGMPPGASGTLTSGGSMATLTAVVSARERQRLDLRVAEQWPVYVGEHRHHSVDRALRFAGLAACPLRVVPSGPGYRMDAAALRRLVDDDVSLGLRPWLVVPTAGTTSSGAIDPLGDIVEIGRSRGLWVHVDAAYGGLFALVESVRGRLNGLAEADSVVVDPHKSLFMPYGTGALLVRDAQVLSDVFAHDASYLAAGEATSPADLGLELTRPFRALGLWLSLQLAGSAAFASALTEKVALAQYAHRFFAGHPRFAVGPWPDLAVVTFRAVPPGGDPDDFNRRLARRLQNREDVFVTATVLDGQVTLRVAVGSVRTHVGDVERALDAIDCEATALARDGTRRERLVVEQVSHG